MKSCAENKKAVKQVVTLILDMRVLLKKTLSASQELNVLLCKFYFETQQFADCCLDMYQNVEKINTCFGELREIFIIRNFEIGVKILYYFEN